MLACFFLLTYDTTSKRLLITQMYVKDSKIFVATQVWRGRPLQPILDLTQVSPAPGIGIVPNCWRYLVHSKLLNAIG